MKKWSFKKRRIFLVVPALLLAILYNVILAEENDASIKQNQPIHITADELVTDSNANTAEFSGNVRAVQGQTVITSERLKLFYAQDQTGEQKIGPNSIDKMEAYGNVRIELDDRVAVTDKAVYTTVDRTLVLTGSGSKIIRGSDQVTASMIIFYRNEGRVVLSGDAQNRVNAVIHSNQRDLN